MTGPAGAGAWPLAAVTVAALCLLPVGAVVWLAWFPAENIWPHLASTVLPGYVGNTLVLLAGVGVSTFLTGVTAARLVTAFDFPGRRAMECLLLLPLAMPGYVIAYLYTDLLEFAGPVQSALRAAFNWRLAGEYWFPEVRSMGGAVMLLGLVLYPYVYLLARASFLEQSSYLADVSRLLGRGPVATFFYVELPIARPAIAVGVALALMEALNDFGTVDFFAVQTLTAGLYDVWLNMGNLGGGAQIGAVMLTFAALLISLEYVGRRRRRFYQSATRFAARQRRRLGGRAGWAAAAVCALPVLFGFVIPAVALAHHALDNFAAAWTPRLRGYALNSLTVSASAALAAVALAVVVAYARRLRRGVFMAAVARAASLGYAVPGAVLAVGVIVPLAAFDNAVDALLRAQFGVGSGLILSGTVFALVAAYTIRFLAVSVGAVEASFGKISDSVDLAARTLGHGPGRALRRFHLPLIKGGALTAALIVFVDCMKELPATLILRPFNFETLATHVYHFASDEMLEQAAPGALFIVAAGLLPVLLLSRTIDSAARLDTVTTVDAAVDADTVTENP